MERSSQPDWDELTDFAYWCCGRPALLDPRRTSGLAPAQAGL